MKKVITMLILSVSLLLSANISSAGLNQWTSSGPGGGRIQAIAVHPTTATTLYVGTYQGGIFKSNNGGATWVPVNTGLGWLDVKALVINPSTHGTMYAGTNGTGIYKSTDSGSNWALANTGITHNIVNALAINPTTPTTIYAGTNAGGVFKSTDSGANWSAVNTGLTSLNIRSIAINPVTASILYAGTDGGVFSSTDNGANWTAVNTGLTNLNVYSVVVNPTTPSTLYAGTMGGGVFKSTDSGANWTAVNTGLPSLGVYSLAVDPTTIYVAGSSGGVYKSVDSGVNWTEAGSGLSYIRAIAVSPTTNSTVYAGTYTDGMFKSTNSGANWTQVNTGLNAVSVNDLAVDPLTPTVVYAGTSGAGLFRSEDSGASWTAMNTGLTEEFIYSIAVNNATPSMVYAGTGNGIFKSTDSASTWTKMSSGIPGSMILSIAIDPLTSSTIYAGTNSSGVYKSTSSGANWVSMSNGLPADPINSLAIDPLTSSTIYAGTDGSGIYKSVDSGENWSAANTGLTHPDIVSIVIDPANPSTVYAGTVLGVFKSTDSGLSWTTANAGLGYGSSRLAINPSVPSVLYAGVQGYGVSKSIDGATSWTQFNTGLTYNRVSSLTVNPLNTNIVYCGMTGASVWQFQLDGPDIAVTDPIAPNKDLKIPFGAVSEGTASDQAVTITNNGTMELTIGSIAVSDVLSAPFSKTSDNCSGQTIAPAGTCTLTVRFAPSAAGTFTDSFDIPSNDPETGSITLALSGTGAPAPDIAVTDSMAPAGDHQLPFGSVAEGNTSNKTVTITNSGNADLVIGTIANANGLAAPFSKTSDNCSGQTIAPAGTCTLIVRFAPSSAGTFSDSFDIPSNDPDEDFVTISVSGTGTAAPVPDISVTDSVNPATDRQVPFGNLTEGIVSSKTVTVTNGGNANLVIGEIASANTLTAPFSITADNCSSKTLAAASTCAFTLRFAPQSAGSFNDTFDIPSNDPDTVSVAMTVSGTGLAASSNNPPTASTLVYPANGQQGLGTTVEFRWKMTTDPDDDPVTYHLYTCTDQNFTGCNPVDVASSNAQKPYFAGLGTYGGLMMIGMVFAAGRRGRKALLLVVVMVLLVTGVTLSSCGGGGGGSASDEVTHTQSGLTSGATYYWKVVADDGKSGTADSTVWSFSVE